MLSISKALIPLFGEVNLLEGQSLELLHRTLDFFVSITKNTWLEKELFKLNKHSTFLKRLDLFRFPMDGVKSCYESVLENSADVLVHLVVEQSLVWLNLFQLLLNLLEVVFSKLRVDHQLLTSLSKYFGVVFLRQFCSNMTSCNCRIQSLVSHINSVFFESFLCLLVEFFPDFTLSSWGFIKPETNLIREPFVIKFGW
jgi:hypothetical protein